MAQPKKKHSKSAKNHRRSHVWKLEQPTLVTCPQCRSPKQPHHVCTVCGYYDGREVINMEKEAASQ